MQEEGEENSKRKIIEGDWVIIKVNEGAKYIVICIKNNATVRVLKKKRFPAIKLLGFHFGDYLELDKKGDISIWDKSKSIKAASLDEDDYNKIGDNRNVKRNDPAVQTLSYEEIEELKNNENVKGTEMINKVASSNIAFEAKTIFSKEKYLKKKQQRHLSIFQIVKPTARTISEAYFAHGPAKVFFIRPDTIAQVLSLGNITSGDSVLIHETCSGLIIGSIAERLYGNGNILSLYTEQDLPINNAFKCFNFSDEIKNVFTPLKFHRLDPLMNINLQDFDNLNNDNDNSFPFKNPKHIPNLRKARSILQNPFDSLIITSKFNPPEILFELWKYLRGCGHLVIYHPHIEPLIQCHEMLLDSGEAICIEIRESWFRDYQVLPLRTHPQMKMHGTSGYILSAIKVLYSENIKKSKQPPKKKKKL